MPVRLYKKQKHVVFTFMVDNFGALSKGTEVVCWRACIESRKMWHSRSWGTIAQPRFSTQATAEQELHSRLYAVLQQQNEQEHQQNSLNTCHSCSYAVLQQRNEQEHQQNSPSTCHSCTCAVLQQRVRSPRPTAPKAKGRGATNGELRPSLSLSHSIMSIHCF